MEPYRKLLARAIGTLVGSARSARSPACFRWVGTHAMRANSQGSTIFEVVAFLVASAPSTGCCFMTGMAAIAAIVAALDSSPQGARVDTRVPKKMLVEQGAPTTADKRAIQDGVDEMALARGAQAEHHRHSRLHGRNSRLFGNCSHRRDVSPGRARYNA